jgi:hypothetical protein
MIVAPSSLMSDPGIQGIEGSSPDTHIYANVVPGISPGIAARNDPE